MKNPFLIGTKIYFRALEPDDAPLLVAWVNDPEVTRTLELFYRPRNLQAEREFIESVNKSAQDVVFAIVVKETDAVIGVAGLHRINFKERHAVFSIFIGEKSEWGKGYGTEATALMVGYAFDTLNLNRVSLQVYEYNQRGIRAYEKVGFVREGVLRQEHYYAGRYWDTIAMAILKEEWEAKKRV